MPAPRYNHREHEHPAQADQLLISVLIVRAHRFGRVSDVELDRPAAGSLEVCEQQPVLRSEQVPWVWLAVEQLLGAFPFDDRLPQASQRVAEQLTVCLREIGSVVAAPDQPLSFRDSIGEVRRGHVDLPHAGMESRERVCVVGWRDRSRRHTFVVGGFCISPQKGALAGFGECFCWRMIGFTEIAIDRRFCDPVVAHQGSNERPLLAPCLQFNNLLPG
jgi:hypothetical protein